MGKDQWVKWNSEGYTTFFGNLGNFEPVNPGMNFESRPVGIVKLEKQNANGTFSQVCNYTSVVPLGKDIGCGYSNGGGQKNSTYRTWGGWNSGMGDWFKIKSGLD